MCHYEELFYFKILRKVISTFMKLPLKGKIFRKHFLLVISKIKKKDFEYSCIQFNFASLDINNSFVEQKSQS